MISQFAIGLRNRFRDYFFPDIQTGKLGSMMQIEEYIEDYIDSYTENTYKMTIELTVDNAQLVAINNMMQHLDKVVFINQPRELKPIIAICLEVRVKLLQKAIKSREKLGSYKLKLSYYMADALWTYLTKFKIIFDLGKYEENVWQRITNQLHEKLQ
ncbi:hypothetical protein [Elizabethkingia anophelis]|uniref:hypothetical protein n=1 Tax=Elizabethkingia anophelis TaxID=1117645 RepID=UPI00389263C8